MTEFRVAVDTEDTLAPEPATSHTPTRNTGYRPLGAVEDAREVEPRWTSLHFLVRLVVL